MGDVLVLPQVGMPDHIDSLRKSLLLFSPLRSGLGMERSDDGGVGGGEEAELGLVCKTKRKFLNEKRKKPEV